MDYHPFTRLTVISGFQQARLVPMLAPHRAYLLLLQCGTGRKSAKKSSDRPQLVNSLLNASGVIAVSRSLRNHVIAAGVPAEKVCVVSECH